MSPLNDHSPSSLINIFSAGTNSTPEKIGHVFLPGWGFDGRIISLQNQVSGWIYPEKILRPADTIRALSEYLDTNNIESIILTGWSMGANIALDFALEHPERIHALYLLALRRSWPIKEINQIREDLHADGGSFLRTFYRKCFLGYREQYKTFQSDIEDDLLAGIDLDTLDDGLKYLAGYNTEQRLADHTNSNSPVYMIYGAKDIICPVVETPDDDNITTIVLDRCGHPVFLEENFPFYLHHRKEAIRKKFCRAADTYDQNAIIQKDIAEKLGKALPASSPAKILELGCGTGNYTRVLSDHYPEATITAIDFAEDMLKIAKENSPQSRHIQYIASDAEQLLRDSEERFDLITSNATIQWFDNIALSSRYMRSLLSDGGNILLSIFGSESMKELQAGLEKILGRDIQLPANFFPNRNKLSKIFNPLFRGVEINEWQIVKEYDSMEKLLEHIRRTGTSGWHPGGTLLTRKRIGELESWFHNKFGKCCITYQVFQVKGGT